MNDPTFEKIENIFRKYLVGVIIMIDEDKKLNVNLKTKMPEEFYIEGNDLFNNAWARYIVTKIDVCDVFWTRKSNNYILKTIDKTVRI